MRSWIPSKVILTRLGIISLVLLCGVTFRIGTEILSPGYAYGVDSAKIANAQTNDTTDETTSEETTDTTESTSENTNGAAGDQYEVTSNTTKQQTYDSRDDTDSVVERQYTDDSDLLQAGAPSAGPVPLMPDGSCPKEFPVVSEVGNACTAK